MPRNTVARKFTPKDFWFLNPTAYFYPTDDDGGNDGGDGGNQDGSDNSGDQGKKSKSDNADGDGKDGADTLSDAGKKALKEERDARKKAEADLKALKKKMDEKADADKTVEQRLAEIEARNARLELERKRDDAVKAAIGKVEDGYSVDREAVDEWLADANLTDDNVSDVVGRAVKRFTKADTELPNHENTQGRSDKPSKLDPKKPPTISEVFG